MISNRLIFGSTAMKHWWPDYDKIPQDIDYLSVSIPEEKEAGKEFYKNGATDYIRRFLNTDPVYVDPDLLYTIKVSHLAWYGKNGKWWKHLKDAIFMKNKGCVLNKEVYKMLYKEWQALHGDKSNISLNKAVEMFFKDGVRREHDHDWLHEHFAVLKKPAYTYILKEEGSPMCSEDTFNITEPEIRFYSALEEMFVVSFERKISLPNAYKGLVTTMTKGWWNLFLIENAEVLLDGFVREKEIYKQKVKLLREQI